MPRFQVSYQSSEATHTRVNPTGPKPLSQVALCPVPSPGGATTGPGACREFLMYSSVGGWLRVHKKRTATRVGDGIGPGLSGFAGYLPRC
jgi:hypothetical protein